MSTNAQDIVGSVNEKISGKAAAGTWVDYCIEGNRISMTFLTKEHKKGNEYERYSFQDNLDFKGMEEIQLNPGETYGPCGGEAPELVSQEATKALRVKKHLTNGQMIMETGTIVYGYAGRALISHFETDQQTKPKGDDGERFLLVHSRTSEPLSLGSSFKTQFGTRVAKNPMQNTTGGTGKLGTNVGDVQAIIYQRGEPYFQNYGFLVYDARTLGRKDFKEIHLDHASRPIYSRDMPNGDFALIFAPLMEGDFGGGKGTKTNFHEKPIFKYLRLSKTGDIIDNIDFQLPKNKMGCAWNLSVIPCDSSDEMVYIVGGGDPDFLGMGIKEVAASFCEENGNLFKCAGTPKKVQIAVGKMGNGKVEYLNLYKPEEIFAKASSSDPKMKMPSGKDAGKFFTYDKPKVIHAIEMDNKDYIVCAGAVNGYQFTIQLNNSGSLEHMFLIQNKKTAYIDGVIFKNEEGKTFQVLTYQPLGENDSENAENNFKRSIVAGEMKGVAPELKSLLPEKTYVDFLNPLKFLKGNEALILGHESKKDISLVKVRFN